MSFERLSSTTNSVIGDRLVQSRQMNPGYMYNTLSQTFQSIRFCNHNKKLSLSYLNAEVLYSLVWCLDDAEDVLKRSSTPNYMDFGANLVKIGHMSPEIEKLESF